MRPNIQQKHIQDFSKKEKQVFVLLLQGFSNQQIAAELGVCDKAVEKHLTNIYKKAGVSCRSEAIIWGLGKGRGIPT